MYVSVHGREREKHTVLSAAVTSVETGLVNGTRYIMMMPLQYASHRMRY